MSIENEMELNVNEINIENEIVRTLENEHLKIKNSRAKDNEEKMQIKFKICIFKEKYGKDIIKMHYNSS
jgi:hypothetical protein